ncbi:MAG: hypothetical protein Q8L69_02860, partial [Gallionellaceae bacterium]|nr:hypothetical protein [Gallionellaceae bacterium]
MNDKLEHFIDMFRQKNGEHEQLVLRIIFTSLILSYLFVELQLGNPQGVTGAQILFATEYLLFSILLAAYVLFRPEASKRRVFLTMICDIGATTYVMLISQDTGPIFFGIFLWVIVGNGIRFGTWSLITSYISSLVGFTLVVLVN